VFRYIALAWDDAHATHASTALRLGLELKASRDWEPAHSRPGLQVYITGRREGANAAYPLPAAQGVVLGKLFRRSELGSPTPKDVSLVGPDGDDAVRDAGATLVHDFWGRYVAFLRTPSGQTRLLRDPSGTLPCFVTVHEGVSIVFSWLEDALDLLSHIALPRIEDAALAAYLLLGELGGQETALRGISQVLPGQCIDLETGKATQLWNAVDIARAPTTYGAEEAARRLRHLVRACTHAWASCYDTLLLRLSGGVDSSILASCLAATESPNDVLCVNYHSPGSDSDERFYARLAAARAGRDLIEREREPGFEIAQTLSIPRMPGPVHYVGSMNARSDARLARAHSAAAMFTGAGGDQLFFEFGAWWPIADYLRGRGIDGGFANAALDAARLGKVSVWRAIALAFADRIHPALLKRDQAPRSVLLSEGLLRRDLARERYIHPALRHPTGLPIGKHMQTRALMHPLGYYDPFEQDAAPEFVHPLLSQPLVELCLRLPTYQLTEGGNGRALARRAFAPDLPARIAGRRSKGGMEEHAVAVLGNNIDFARGLLLEGELVRRQLIDRNKVEEILSGRPTALICHPSQIHSLIAIEAWLSRWCDTPPPTQHGKRR
jgi:asparagine synthase (glutamine-hydrolysing)